MMLKKRLQQALILLQQADGHQRIGKRVVHGFSWAIVATLVTRIFTFGVALVQSNILGKQGYGELGIILNTLLLFGIVSSGYGSTCSKFISELKETDKTRAEKIFALSISTVSATTIAASICLILVSDQLADFTLHAHHLAPLLRTAVIVLTLQALIGVLDGVLSGLQAFKRKSVVALVQPVVWLPATAILTSSYGVQGSVIAYLISYLASMLAYAYALYRECRRQSFYPITNGMWSEFSILLQYTLPMVMHSLLVVPTTWICNTILVQQANGYAELGGYNAASQWRIIVLQLPILLQSTIAPVMSEAFGRRDMKAFLSLFNTAFEMTSSVALVASVGCILSGRVLMSLFGKEFISDSLVMGFVVTTSAIMSLSGLVGVALQMLNRVWIALVANLALTLVSVAFSALLVPTHGSVGLGLAFLIAYSLQFLLLIFLLRFYLRQIKLSLALRQSASILLLCLLATYIASLSGSYNEFIKISFLTGIGLLQLRPLFSNISKLFEL